MYTKNNKMFTIEDVIDAAAVNPDVADEALRIFDLDSFNNFEDAVDVFESCCDDVVINEIEEM